MNVTRFAIVAAVVSLAACSSSSDPAGPAANDTGVADDTASRPDGAVADSNAEDVARDTSISSDAAIDSSAPPIDTAPPPAGSAYVRIFDGDDGAAIYVCQDGSKIGDSSYDRISPGGRIASGYIETTAFGTHKVHAQATTAAACLSASSGDPSYSLSKGDVKTLFVKGITGFTGIVAITDDVTAPAAGKARVRIYDGATAFTAAHGSALDVCTGTTAWAHGLAGSSSSAYLEVAPGAVSLDVRETATAECTGALLGTVSITAAGDATHTLFLVDGKGADGKPHASFCTDANAGIPVKTAACTDATF
jgi:hypothetical protein